MRQRPLVLGVGEILWDMLPSGKKMGGAPANFTYHVAALGTRAALVSRVGNDANGRAILARLDKLGIENNHVSIDPTRPTGVVEVKVDAHGKPAYTIKTDAAWDNIPFTSSLRALAAQADATCFGTLAQRSLESRANLQQFLQHTRSNSIRILDLNLRQTFFSADLIKNLLSICTVLKLNDEELQALGRMLGITGSLRMLAEKILAAFNLKLVALTQGGKGSMLLSRHKQHIEPAHATTVADTIGAGDSFSAVLAIGLLKGWTLAQINHSANKLAAFVCSKRGATPKLPSSLITAVLNPTQPF